MGGVKTVRALMIVEPVRRVTSVLKRVTSRLNALEATTARLVASSLLPALQELSALVNSSEPKPTVKNATAVATARTGDSLRWKASAISSTTVWRSRK